MQSSPKIGQRRALLIFLLVGLMTLAYSSIGIYTPAMPAIGEYFNVPASEVQFTFSIYIISFALGQLFYGPLSDRYGRRPAIIIGLVIYLIGCILAIISYSIEILIIARGIQAFGGCVGPVVGRAIIKDLYERDQGAKILSYVAMAMSVAPAFAPVVGGYLQVEFNWQSIFILLFFLGIFFLTFNAVFLDETNKNTVISKINFFDTIKDYYVFMQSRLFLGYTLSVSFVMSIIFVYSSGAPFILIDLLGVSPDRYGWYVLIPTIFNLVGAFFTTRTINYFGGEKLIILGGVSIAIGGVAMVLYGLLFPLSIISIIGPICFVMFGIALLYPPAAQSAIGIFPGKTGSASSLNAFLHMFIAACMVLISSYLFDGGHWVLIKLVALNSILALFSIFLIFYGKKTS